MVSKGARPKSNDMSNQQKIPFRKFCSGLDVGQRRPGISARSVKDWEDSARLNLLPETHHSKKINTRRSKPEIETHLEAAKLEEKIQDEGNS